MRQSEIILDVRTSPFYATDPAQFNSLTQLLSTWDSSMQEFESRDYRPFTVVTTLLMTKAVKSAYAVLLLCGEGYGQDAANLARSILDIFMTMKYMEDDPDFRAELWNDWGAWEKMKNIEELIQAGIATADDLQRLKQEYEEAIREGKRADKEHEFSKKGRFKSWSGKSTRCMANDCNIGQTYYAIFKRLSKIEHPSSLIAEHYVENESGTVAFSYEPTESMVGEALDATYLCLYQIAVIWNRRTQAVILDNSSA